MMKPTPKHLAAAALLAASPALADVTIDVGIPNFGFTTILIGGNPEYDGWTVTGAEFFLELDVTSGDAANILVDMTAAVDTDPSTDVIDGYGMSAYGSQIGWSGQGIVSHEFDASGFIGGVFYSDLIYGSSITGTFGDIFNPGEFAIITDNSYFRLTLVPAPSTVALLGLGAPIALRRRR